MQEIAIKYIIKILLGAHYSQKVGKEWLIFTPLCYFHLFKKIRKFISSFSFEINTFYFLIAAHVIFSFFVDEIYLTLEIRIV